MHSVSIFTSRVHVYRSTVCLYSRIIINGRLSSSGFDIDNLPFENIPLQCIIILYKSVAGAAFYTRWPIVPLYKERTKFYTYIGVLYYS